MIEVKNLSVSYQRGEEVLKGLSFHLEPGGFYFLTGPSGAGKSTLLRILSMIQTPTRGERLVFGKNTAGLPQNELAYLRRKIGLVFQDHHLLDHLTVEENVALPLKVAGESPSQIRPKVYEMLEWVGLGTHIQAYPSTLSGGQKQRAAIARAVINNPTVLLADEPTGNLDPALAVKIMYLFQALNKMGATILFATHDESLIAQFDYPVYALREGVMVRRS